MKILSLIAILLAVSAYTSASSLRKQQQTLETSWTWKTVTDVNQLSTSKTYYIVNQHFQKFYGKDHLGWVFDGDAGSWTISHGSSSTINLRHSSGKYLTIDSNGRSFTAKGASTRLRLFNRNSGICISKAGSYILRMYYQYTFPLGQYKTNTTDICGAWELFEFRYKD